MKTLYTLIIAIIAFFTLLLTPAKAQEKASPLTHQEQQILLDSITVKLNVNYIFPDVATEMIASVQSKFKKGNYKSILDPQEFGNTLTTDLQAISHDKHLSIRFAPERIAEQRQTVTAQDSLDYLNRSLDRMKRNNFGFKEVKILDGNIGYLNLSGFSDVEHGGETAVSAMNFLSNTDAIIIDLRNNGGGSPQMIQLITSYLYESEPVHLNNFYWRPTDTHTQTWTLPHVSGKRSPNTPVYILTSSYTFSAAEEFSYNLKNMERATLVGETTGGGAHPVDALVATDRYMIWVPVGRAINPITNTNWEGTGVSPHIAVASTDALDVAQIKALEVLLEESNDEELNKFYNWNLTGLKAQMEPVDVDSKTLKSYTGYFGPRHVSFENNTLFYQRDKGTKHELVPLTQNEFKLKSSNSFRIRFMVENGKTIGLEGHYDNGHSDKNLKDKD
ncbi:MAG: C-terminal processing protease CtpA/Prc [Patiriisocius sp.]|jgi:C-terminal processing protease CtpA/Prc